MERTRIERMADELAKGRCPMDVMRDFDAHEWELFEAGMLHGLRIRRQDELRRELDRQLFWNGSGLN